MNILLIAGHGNGDPGAGGNGFWEADLTREVVKLLQPKLAKICNCDIADTSKNWFEYLGIHSYDFSKYSYVLEIHFNSGGGYGSEIYLTNSGKATGAENAIVKRLSEVGYRNRGVKRTNFRVISRIAAQGIPAALLEVAFIDSTSDMTLWKNKKDEIITAIAKGIADGFGLSYEEELTMTQYEELNEKIESVAEDVEKITPMIYDYIDENMPAWARPTIQKLKDKGLILGDENGKLGLTDELLKMFVVNDRAGLYD